MPIHSTSSTDHGESTSPGETEEPRAAGPSQSAAKPAQESASPTTGAASGNESSADFLRAYSADQADAGETSNHAETTYGKLLRPPHPGGQDRPSSIAHPIRPSSSAAEPPPFAGPPKDKLDKLVDGTDPYPDKPRPRVEEHDVASSGLRRYGSKDDDSGTPDKLKPGRTGMIPTDSNRLQDHPDYAEQEHRRPEQILSHFSTVMLYQQNKDQTKKNQEVEVQYGYLRDGNNLKLYSSANSYKGQQWLKKNSHEDKLLEHVKAAAKQDKDPEVKRHALKLLFFDENQKARRDEINKSGKPDKEKKELLKELDETDKIHKEFFTGTHHVVTNTAGAQEEDGKQAQQSKKGGQDTSAGR